jgi:hypothetical protein
MIEQFNSLVMTNIRRSVSFIREHFDLLNVLIVLLALIFVFIYFPKNVQQITQNGAREMVLDNPTELQILTIPSVQRYTSWMSMLQFTAVM